MVVTAFGVGYLTLAGGLIGGFRPTAEVAVRTWQGYYLSPKHK